MANRLEIQEGDIVNVFVSDSKAYFNVKVLYIPVATGDSWRFERESTGLLIYVQFFQAIEREF